jgi:3-isopropylmalate dehydrogenase
MLRYSFDQDRASDLLDGAIARVLASGLRTADIMQEGKAKVSTSTMGEAIVRELDKAAA